MPLRFGVFDLGKLEPFSLDVHSVDGKLQWTPQPLWAPLLLIGGLESRGVFYSSDELLDETTFTDADSPRYRQPGISLSEWRIGAFLHAELTPVDWMTASGSLRLDHNSETGEFLSPRLAVVLNWRQRQFFRLAVARSFRKPSFMEKRGHLSVQFPADTLVPAFFQEMFQDFASQNYGNGALQNEQLLSFEAGYVGHFLAKRLTITLDLYANRFTNLTHFEENFKEQTPGIPDLAQSSLRFVNSAAENQYVLGSELSVRYHVSRGLSVFASWTHRETLDFESFAARDIDPKNLLGVGGFFQTDRGLLGSLGLCSRSAFWNRQVENPQGLLAGSRVEYIDTVMLVLARDSPNKPLVLPVRG